MQETQGLILRLEVVSSRRYLLAPCVGFTPNRRMIYPLGHDDCDSVGYLINRKVAETVLDTAKSATMPIDYLRGRNCLILIPSANQKDKLQAGHLAKIRLDYVAWLFGTENRNGPLLADGDAGRTRLGRDFQQRMQEHHYLEALHKIDNTIRYVAAVDGCWLGLLSFSAPALKCAARDEWIGWSRAHRTDRFNLVAKQFAFSDSARP